MDKKLQIRLTAAMLQGVHEAAKAEGMTISEMLRAFIEQKVLHSQKAPLQSAK